MTVRCRAVALVMLSAVSAVHADDAVDGVRIVEHRRQHVIDAKDAHELQEQLDALHARGGSHGYTKRSFEARFDAVPSASGCRVDALEVTVHVITGLPHWRSPRKQPLLLRQRWEEAIAGLDRHERGHRDNAVAAAKTIRRELDALPVAADCDALRKQAQRIVDRHLFRADMRDIAYDHRTARGAAQGATLVLGEPQVDYRRSSAMRLRERMRYGEHTPVHVPPWRRGTFRRLNAGPEGA